MPRHGIGCVEFVFGTQQAEQHVAKCANAARSPVTKDTLLECEFPVEIGMYDDDRRWRLDDPSSIIERQLIGTDVHPVYERPGGRPPRREGV